MNTENPEKSTLGEEEMDLVFELWDAFYESGSEALQEWFKREDEFLYRHIQAECTLLDLGFGSGRHLRKVSNIAKMAYGIDKSNSFYEGFIKASDKYQNIKIFHENAQSTHFEDEFFDYIICMDNTFGNFGLEGNAILKEMKRILKADGKMLLSVYSENALEERIKEYQRIGLTTKSVDKETGLVIGENNIAMEQFTKEKLKEIFDKHNLKYEIDDETPISYMLIVSK